MMGAVRSFFLQKEVMEVDCPLSSSAASVDPHIDLVESEGRFLHSSPEYGMKRLLAEGLPDLYQMSHVFRQGEEGARHNPEFMLVEWYRRGFSFDDMVEETALFIALFLGNHPLETLSYREAFRRYVDLDPMTASWEECRSRLDGTGLFSPSLLASCDRDDLLNFLLAHFVEPLLGRNSLCALTHYPASQAALAQCVQEEGHSVAERFEIYFQGIELANGYHELHHAQEQRQRLEEANLKRLALGKRPLPLDERFLQSLDQLPPCCGVAVGFDRLMMLRHGASHIREVLPFCWQNA